MSFNELFIKRPDEFHAEDSSKTRKVTAKELEIETRPAETSNELGGGENASLFCKLKNDGSVVFKPMNGECRKQLRDGVPVGTQYIRERASYLVSEFLGFNLVPATVIRDIGGEVGSAQEFIPDAVTGKESRFLDSETLDLELLNTNLYRMAIFDLLVLNTDRHGGNYLIDKSGTVIAIDNGLCFGNFASEFKPERWLDGVDLPSEVVEKIRQFWENEDVKKILRTLLFELLKPKEVDRFFGRIGLFIERSAERNKLSLSDIDDILHQGEEKSSEENW